MIIYPDAYTPSSAGAPTVTSGGTVTAADWRKMQLQGCVFLPYAGWIASGSNPTYNGQRFYTWAESDGGKYFFVMIYSSIQTNTSRNKASDRKMSIRLVHNL